jgi:hypothetical protein
MKLTFMRTTFTIFSFIFFLASITMAQDSMDFTFYDGNANQYIIKERVLFYKAVKPINSSSSIYSGGIDTLIKLSEKLCSRLEEKRNALLQNKKDVIKTSLMGSYTFVENKKKIIFKMKCKEAEDLTTFLRSICIPK